MMAAGARLCNAQVGALGFALQHGCQAGGRTCAHLHGQGTTSISPMCTKGTSRKQTDRSAPVGWGLQQLRP
jgi:hypothetical protein